MSKSNTLRYLLPGLFLLASSTSALSHPHEFIDMKIKVLFSSAHEVTGMHYVWLFDEFFTAYAVEPADRDGDGKPEAEGLKDLAVEILGNIKKIDYFTKFDENALVPELAKATPISATMQKRQLRLEFKVDFKEPINIKNKPMTYGIYDNEFYIAMHHSVKDDAVRLEGAGKGCGYDLIVPDPTEEIQNFASSLGKDESGGQDLGYHFAEWVTVKCQ